MTIALQRRPERLRAGVCSCTWMMRVNDVLSAKRCAARPASRDRQRRPVNKQSLIRNVGHLGSAPLGIFLHHHTTPGGLFMRGGVSMLAIAVGLAATSLAHADDYKDFGRDLLRHIEDEFRHERDRDNLDSYKHIVVIYQENHSFDNLYGFWGNVGGDKIEGQADADQAHTTQVRQDNQTAYKCLLQNDVNLPSPSPL